MSYLLLSFPKAKDVILKLKVRKSKEIKTDKKNSYARKIGNQKSK